MTFIPCPCCHCHCTVPCTCCCCNCEVPCSCHQTKGSGFECIVGGTCCISGILAKGIKLVDLTITREKMGAKINRKIILRQDRVINVLHICEREVEVEVVSSLSFLRTLPSIFVNRHFFFQSPQVKTYMKLYGR